jgi:putative hydrolase of the HAD superfamily
MADRSPIWLFDLDNTLHDAGFAIFPTISENMNGYISALLGQNGEPANSAIVNAVRHEYWQRYGATLLGLMKHHNVKAQEFLHAAHSFEHLPSMIRAERGLARLLSQLPGRKILLTNAPKQYSSDVIRHLGLHRHFAEHIPIEDMRVHGKLQPKPSAQFLRKLLAKLGVQAHRCILVEDSIPNLRAAKRVGMRTALVTRYTAPLSPAQKISAACVDVRVNSVFKLSQRYRDLHCKSVVQSRQ